MNLRQSAQVGRAMGRDLPRTADALRRSIREVRKCVRQTQPGTYHGDRFREQLAYLAGWLATGGLR